MGFTLCPSDLESLEWTESLDLKDANLVAPRVESLADNIALVLLGSGFRN